MPQVKLYFDQELKFDSIAETYFKSYKRKLDPEYWNWRFCNNPYNRKIFISYILENEILAAYYAASPCFIRINNVSHKFILVNMAMTHPDYQGKGYLKRVAGELYRELDAEGYIGALGFANAQSHYGHRKYLNWSDLCVLNNFSADKHTFKPGNEMSDIKFGFESGDVDKCIIELTQSMICCNKKVHINRDITFLDWRLRIHPMYRYFYLKINDNGGPAGLIFYKLYNGNADIMEFFYNPEWESENHHLLIAGINELMKISHESVQIWSNLQSDEHLQLEKSGFRETSFITYMGIIPFHDYPEIRDLKNWHYRFIDSDVF
jgi:hypothetical protein